MGKIDDLLNKTAGLAGVLGDINKKNKENIANSQSHLFDAKKSVALTGADYANQLNTGDLSKDSDAVIEAIAGRYGGGLVDAHQSALNTFNNVIQKSSLLSKSQPFDQLKAIQNDPQLLKEYKDYVKDVGTNASPQGFIGRLQAQAQKGIEDSKANLETKQRALKDNIKATYGDTLKKYEILTSGKFTKGLISSELTDMYKSLSDGSISDDQFAKNLTTLQAKVDSESAGYEKHLMSKVDRINDLLNDPKAHKNTAKIDSAIRDILGEDYFNEYISKSDNDVFRALNNLDPTKAKEVEKFTQYEKDKKSAAAAFNSASQLFEHYGENVNKAVGDLNKRIQEVYKLASVIGEAGEEADNYKTKLEAEGKARINYEYDAKRIEKETEAKIEAHRSKNEDDISKIEAHARAEEERRKNDHQRNIENESLREAEHRRSLERSEANHKHEMERSDARVREYEAARSAREASDIFKKAGNKLNDTERAAVHKSIVDVYKSINSENYTPETKKALDDLFTSSEGANLNMGEFLKKAIGIIDNDSQYKANSGEVNTDYKPETKYEQTLQDNVDAAEKPNPSKIRSEFIGAVESFDDIDSFNKLDTSEKFKVKKAFEATKNTDFGAEINKKVAAIHRKYNNNEIEYVSAINELYDILGNLDGGNNE